MFETNSIFQLPHMTHTTKFLLVRYTSVNETDLPFFDLICYVSVLNAAAVFCQVEVGSTIALELDRRLQNDIQFNFDNCLQKRVLPSAGKLLTLGCAEGRKWGLM